MYTVLRVYYKYYIIFSSQPSGDPQVTPVEVGILSLRITELQDEKI